MTDAAPPVPPRPSASLVIGREGVSGWEIFMVQRHSATRFAGGALVFPGGALEAQDTEVSANSDSLSAHRLAAIREVFEEAGILFARHLDGSWPAPELLAELAGERERVACGEVPFGVWLAQQGLCPATDALVPFAYWVTPSTRPKRFATHFFVAELPPLQVGSHDGVELVDSFWAAPAQVVALGEAGEYWVMRATEVNCRRLSAYPSCAAALADFRTHPESLVTPTFFAVGGRRYLSVPARGGRGVLTLAAEP